MFNNKLKILSMTLVLLLLLVPAALANEEIESLIEEYELDYLTEDEETALVEALTELDESEKIDRDTIEGILEDLQIEEDEDVDENEEEGLGEELASLIADIKDDEDWTGQELSSEIQTFLNDNTERVEVQNQEKAQNQNENAEENKENAQNKGNNGNNGQGKGNN
ncbi:MAG: hypothetical protein R6V14_06860 [Halanaerobiales bacterium]